MRRIHGQMKWLWSLIDHGGGTHQPRLESFAKEQPFVAIEVELRRVGKIGANQLTHQRLAVDPKDRRQPEATMKLRPTLASVINDHVTLELLRLADE
jgi:hypothetical protein